MTRHIAFTYVDVFTARPLAGNQLAVCTDAAAVPDAMLQALAREIGFSETVFVYEGADGTDARVRIFTPVQELRFAGHPVLGTAYVLAQRHGVDRIVLGTKAGAIPVEFDTARRGRMTQPIPSVAALPADDVAAMCTALGIERSEQPVEVYDNGLEHAYFVLPDQGAVAALRPDLTALAAIAGLMGTNCAAGAGTNWKTRMFIPDAGVGEDPATGSAAGPLAVHLARHDLVPWGEEITISQGAELNRPSTLYAVAHGRGGQVERVEVAGDAVIVAETTFTLP